MNAPEPTKKLGPSPTACALLNCFPFVFGLGYLPLGNYWRFVSVLGLQFLGPILLGLLGFRNLAVWFLVILWAGSIIDVYNQAKQKREQAT